MIGETVTRQRAGSTTNRYGDTVADWDAATSTSLAGCALAPAMGGEDHDHREGVILGWTLYAPPGTDIDPADRIVARGVTYEVDGEPGTWVDPYSGRTTGIEVPLRVVTG